jgi:hypothetical protein
MSRFESITIREVEYCDLETFCEHQLDPEAIRMAAFVCEDPKDKAAFDALWDKILNSPQNTKGTIVAEGQLNAECRVVGAAPSPLRSCVASCLWARTIPPGQRGFLLALS